MSKKLNVPERRQRNAQIIGRYQELVKEEEPMPWAILASEFPDLTKRGIISVVRRSGQADGAA